VLKNRKHPTILQAFKNVNAVSNNYGFRLRTMGHTDNEFEPMHDSEDDDLFIDNQPDDDDEYSPDALDMPIAGVVEQNENENEGELDENGNEREEPEPELEADEGEVDHPTAASDDESDDESSKTDENVETVGVDDAADAITVAFERALSSSLEKRKWTISCTNNMRLFQEETSS
jgi:hypothetical protein